MHEFILRSDCQLVKNITLEYQNSKYSMDISYALGADSYYYS